MNCKPITWAMVEWLEAQGVPRPILKQIACVQTLRGSRDQDGWLDESPDGNVFLAFYEELPDDCVCWCPKTGELATLFGRAFALGEDNISNAQTYAFDTHLHLHCEPLDWLRDEGRGIVVLDWSKAFERLRYAPRIAVAEALLPDFRQSMVLSRMPLIFVIASNVRLAA